MSRRRLPTLLRVVLFWIVAIIGAVVAVELFYWLDRSSCGSGSSPNPITRWIC
jgi:hypothetical protein